MIRYVSGLITFECDTPNCKASIYTGRRAVATAAAKARREGWAIGTSEDACRVHHV
jgi:hypothetical protein